MWRIDNNLFDILPEKYPTSPLRYPGSKRKGTQQILSLIPRDTKKLVSPFMGGGSIELVVSSLGIPVEAYDLFEFVVAFWRQLKTHPEQLHDEAMAEIPMTKPRFYQMQKMDYTRESEYIKALNFYLLNRTSFLGTTFSGGCAYSTLKILSRTTVAKLLTYDLSNLEVNQKSFEETLEDHKSEFAYLDPPYINRTQTLYGKHGNMHKDFPHQRLADMLNERDNWLLSYNDCPEVREMYKGHRILECTWGHRMSKIEFGELIIASDDLPEISGQQ